MTRKFMKLHLLRDEYFLTNFTGAIVVSGFFVNIYPGKTRYKSHFPKISENSIFSYGMLYLIFYEI